MDYRQVLSRKYRRFILLNNISKLMSDASHFTDKNKMKSELIRARDQTWADYKQAILSDWDEQAFKEKSQQYKLVKEIWNHHECQIKKLNDYAPPEGKENGKLSEIKQITQNALLEIKDYRKRQHERDD